MNKHRFHLFISILIVVALSLLVFAPCPGWRRGTRIAYHTGR